MVSAWMGVSAESSLGAAVSRWGASVNSDFLATIDSSQRPFAPYILVLEGNQLVGILTWADSLRAIVQHPQSWQTLSVATVMQPQFPCLRVEDWQSPTHCLKLFRTSALAGLPMLDRESRPLGMVPLLAFLQSLPAQNLLKLGTVKDVMNQQRLLIPAQTPLRQLVQWSIEQPQQRLVIVESEVSVQQPFPLPVGWVGAAQLIQAYGQGRDLDQTPASAVMQPLAPLLNPRNSLYYASEQLQQRDLVVVAERWGDRFQGVLGTVTAQELLQALVPGQVKARIQSFQQSIVQFQIEKAKQLKVSNLQLEQQVQQRTTELHRALIKVESQAKQAELVNQIVQAMRGTLVLDEILQTTANQLHSALKVSRCLIFRPDESQQLAVQHISEGTPEGLEILGVRCQFYNDYRETLAQGQVVAFSDVAQQCPSELQSKIVGCSITSLLIVPLVYQDTLLGGISLQEAEETRAWQADEIALAKAIADHCAIAIHQAELYQQRTTELQERQKAEATLREQEALLQTVTRNVPVILFAIDQQGIFTFAQGRGREFPGNVSAPLPPLEGLSIFERYRDYPQILDCLRRTLAGEELTWQAEFLGRIFESRTRPVYDAQGQPNGLVGVASDVTEQVKAEQQERERQRLFHAIFNNTYQLTGLLTPEGRLIEANQTALDFGGIQPEDAIGQSFWDCYWWTISPDTQQQLQQAIQQAAQGRFIRYQVDVWGADQQVVTIDFSLKPVCDDQEQVLYLIAEGRDISQQQQALRNLQKAEADLQQLNAELEQRVEERTHQLHTTVQQLEAEIRHRQRIQLALVESQQQLQAILDNASAVVSVVDTQNRYLLINKLYETLFQTSQQEIVGKHLEEVWEPEFAAQFAAHNQQVLSQGTALEVEETAPQSDGIHTYISVKFPLFDSEGQPYAVCGISTDITARKRAEEALKTSESKFQKLVTNVPGMIYQFVMHPDGSLAFPYVSPQCRQIYELEPQAVQNNSQLLFDQVHPEDSALVLSSTLESGASLEAWRCEFRILTPSGQLKWIQGYSRPEKQTNGDILWDGFTIDITDRKLAETALQNSELQRSLALKAAQMGTWDWNSETGEIHWSRQTEIIYGYEPGTFPGTYDAFIAQVYPEDREVLSQAINQAMREQAPYEIEHRIVWCDGSVRWVSAKGNVISNSQGQIIGISGVVMDITERKQAEVSLLRQLAAVEAASDGIAIVNQAGEYVYLNHSHLQIFGYSQPEDLLGKSWKNLYTPEEGTRIEQEQFPKLLQSGRWQGEVTARRGDGSLFAQEISLTLIADGGIVCVCRDITARKEVEKQLVLRDRAIAASNNGIIITDAQQPNQPVIYVNPAFETMTGYTLDEAIGRNCRFLQGSFTNQPGLITLRQALKRGIGCTVTLQNIRKNGSIFWNELSISPIHDTQGTLTHYIGIQTDITERKAAESQLRASLKEKEVLLKEIHHRVKNNLQVISSLLKLQSAHIKDEQVLSQLRDSYNRVHSMALIHEKLYQSEGLSRIDSADYVRNLAENLLRSYNVSITLELKTEVENIELDIDTAIPCGLILNELISNSLKYAFKGRSQGRISIQFSQQTEQEVQLKVADNGIGLPSDFDLEETESLGLQLVQNLTEQLDGTLQIDSQDGTCFMITFPMPI